jgi:hypothetical protein
LPCPRDRRGLRLAVDGLGIPQDEAVEMIEGRPELIESPQAVTVDRDQPGGLTCFEPRAARER